MLKKEYKNMMDKIQLSERKKEEIYMNTIENLSKKNKKHYFKPILITSIICLCAIIGTLGTVYAEELKETIQKIFIKRTHDEEKNYTKLETDDLAGINCDADIPEYNPQSSDEMGKGINYSYAEIENLLGVKILKSDLFKKTMLYQEKTNKQDGKITFAWFSINDFMISPKKFDGIYNMNISFLTSYASEEEKNDPLFEGRGSFNEEEYYLSKLNTMAYFIKKHDGHDTQSWDVIFMYNNINYRFSFDFMREDHESMRDEVIQILESLYL